MVALFGLLQHGEVSLHLGLVLKSRAVDALELRIALVAFVVGAGEVRQLERPDATVCETCGPAQRSVNWPLR